MDHRLFYAARTVDIISLEFLLQEDPLLLDRLSLSSPENPLHVSAFSGQARFAAEILRLKQGLALDLNHQGFSPLHIASASGELEVVRVILRVGKRDACLVKNKDGLLPLHCAAQRGRSDVIKELVLFCPESLKILTTASQETPLHFAVKNNQVEATMVLLEEIKKHDMAPDIINWGNQEGNTVLHLATLGKQLEIVEMLIGERPITNGVNPNISNCRGLTPKDILDLVLETEGGSVSEMYKLVKIFQKAEAINGQESSNKPHRLRQPFSSPKFHMKLWEILDWEIKDIPTHQRDALVVVAVLIATLTYQSIISPPGSFRTEENGGNTTIASSSSNNAGLPGRAIMAKEIEIFTFYAVFNAIGFLASVSMISLLTKGFYLRDLMRLCIISMMATYIIAIFYISPNKKPFMWVVLAFSALLVLREIVLFIRSLLKKINKSPSPFVDS